MATHDGASGSWTALSSSVDVLCAHRTCVESTNKLTNRIEETCESERTTPRMGFPSLRVWVASAFLSIAKAQGWRKCGTHGLRDYNNPRQFPDVCLVKIAHSRLHTRSHRNWLVRGRIYKVRSSRQLYLLGPPQSTSVALA